MPPTWVPAASRRIAQNRLDEILAEEKRWARQANLEREQQAQEKLEREEMARKLGPVATGLSVIAFLSVAFFYWKEGRSVSVPYSQKVDASIPDQHSLALTSVLYRKKQVSGEALAATLFDLARRRILTIVEVEKRRKWWHDGHTPFEIRLDGENLKRQSDSLEDYETSLIEFLFEEVGQGGDHVDSRQIRKQSRKMKKWFQKWKKLLSTRVKDVRLYEGNSVRAAVFAAVASGLVAIIGLVLVIQFGRPGLIALSLSPAILRFTPEMKVKRLRWKAFHP